MKNQKHASAPAVGAQHTPERWEIIPRYTGQPTEETYFNGPTAGPIFTLLCAPPRREKIARMVGAAPDLLAALERLANAVTAHRQAITIRALDELCDAEDNARDQIAKAKGQP
jgi:hypothetical protein